MKSGIINILKPSGMTSNDVLSQIKRKLHPNKIGHLGTLDPNAVGVLPVAINKATKLFDYYLKKNKVYNAVFVFGKETDTLDSDGKVLNECDCDISIGDIERILPDFIGKQEQMPPQYSAKKVNGKNAYELARNGIAVELKPKLIEINKIELVKQLKKNTFLFTIECSSGTYVRSIARDIAKELNTFAYCGAIIRVKSGHFDIQSAVTIDDVTEQSIISLEEILKDWKKVFVDSKFYDKIVNGNQIRIGLQDMSNVVIICNDKIMGIGNIKNDVLKIETSLWEKND